MAAVFVGEAVLSAFLQVAFERLASPDVVNFLKGKKGIDGLVEELKIVMISANSVSNDAEEKQFTDSNVKQWLDELEDAVYVADDLLDEIATEALRSKSEAAFQTGTRKVWGFIPTFANSFDKKIQSEMVKILKRLELIIKQKDALGLVPSVAPKDAPGLKVLQSRPLTTSHPEVYGVFGRDKEMEAIFEKFQSNGASDDGICVVPIVGMGGVGKTTLARLIYNDRRIEERFDNKVWVCVSENFDRDRILKTISEAISEANPEAISEAIPEAIPNDQNMNSPQNELSEKYTGKKIFLVLDDIWNEDYCDWVELIKDFRHGAKEIKIIVTTRSEKVALNTGEAFSLKQLSDDECWSLFEKHACIDEKASEFPILVDIGKKIVQKCKGLPLAAKALGGLLHRVQDPKEWTKILENDVWDLREGQLLPALRLSYHYLPSHLKHCFAYCSIFPKDYEFKKEEVVLLWMAQDFLQQYKGNGRMEEIGKGYFDDLVSRSLFQRSGNNESYFIMHDLVNDMAKLISGEFCFRLEEDKWNKITKKTRHFFYPKGKFDDSKKFEILYEAKGLRTFLGEKGLPEKVMLDDLLKQFKALRVLTLFSMGIRELPNSIDNLKHLRYLNILCTEIYHLPNSLCNLYCLQTLILSRYITKMPTNTSKLVNLRHLDYSKANLEEMPPQMGKLKNLRKLPYFVVEKHDDGSSIRELGELQHLSGKLSLLNLENVQCINRDTTEIILKNKQDLSELKLEWKRGYGAEDSEKELILLEHLCPHTNLNSLTITNYEGTKFPKWLGDSSYSQMASIKLSNCENCYSLPPLGKLPHLKHLEIKCFGKILEVGLEFYGNAINPFGALECLSFENMPEWQQWVLFKGEVFTCLRQLYIKDCPKLSGGLPVQLPSLTKISGGRVSQHIQRVRYSPALHGKSVNIEGGINSIWPVLSEFTSVTHLNLFSCPDLVSFPSGSGRLCAPNLSQIVIESCKNLKSLPEGMHNLLPSLVRLGLLHCPKLNSFPEGGLPSSLESLHICKCDRLFSSRMQWGLQDLHSLRSFKIFVGKKQKNLESFPEDALLPPNLTNLYISLSNLKSLNDKGFQHLTSLKHLKIWKCNDLDCLLEKLLSTSLCELDILNCHLLNNRYQYKEGEYPRMSIRTKPRRRRSRHRDCFCAKMHNPVFKNTPQKYFWPHVGEEPFCASTNSHFR